METLSALLAICAGNSPVTGEFLAQMANNAGNVSIWWRHHLVSKMLLLSFLGFDVPDRKIYKW